MQSLTDQNSKPGRIGGGEYVTWDSPVTQSAKSKIFDRQISKGSLASQMEV